MSYKNTGNTTYAGITQAQLSQFESSLPREVSGVPQQVASGAPGTEQFPTTPVIIAPGGTNYSYDFDSQTYLLAGSNSTLDLRPSHADSGGPVSVNVQLSGHDTITLNHGADMVLDTGGFNKIVANGGHDTITSAGNNLIQVQGHNNIVFGNTNDTIQLGYSTNDVVGAGTGPETIAGGFDSFIYGGGQTSIVGGVNNTITLKGHDTLASGPNGAYNDTVDVSAGSHALIRAGNSENMDITINAGKNAAQGMDHGQDTIFGGSNTVIHVGSLGGVVSTQTDPNNAKLTEIKFASGDTLHVHNVTLDLGNNQTTKIS